MYLIALLCLFIIPFNNGQVFFPNRYQPLCGQNNCGSCSGYPFNPNIPSNSPRPTFLYPFIHNKPYIFPTRTTPKLLGNTKTTISDNVITKPTSTSMPTPSQHTTSTTTPCPQAPNRCPAVGNPSATDCLSYKRVFPNPVTCTSSRDCPEPFNTCCEDACFGTKICKTYMKEFEM
ncbi:hypothetical protein FQA39_LY17146 [Lamprigera yunnana]|nr:hypothetical protein FQA39_LY17146 [Lamprigera yunnana]